MKASVSANTRDPAARLAIVARKRAATSPPASLRDQAHAEIKRRIITLAYRPGAYLNAARLGQELGLGFTPINQALNRLMLEGMVEVIPRKGVIVRPVSVDEILQIIEVRLVNETYCAELAAERATEAELRILDDIVERAGKAARSRDVEQLMVLDRAFHAALNGAARNPVLGEILLTLHERSLRFWFISLSDESHITPVLSEHRSILKAVRARDRQAAAAAIRAHIESFRSTILKSV